LGIMKHVNFVNMDIQATKLDLIQWLLELSDENLIAKIQNLRNAETDWWDEIGEEEKEAINEGISQADRGELISHEEARKKINSKFGI
jgi:hypothetical protein